MTGKGKAHAEREELRGPVPGYRDMMRKLPRHPSDSQHNPRQLGMRHSEARATTDRKRGPLWDTPRSGCPVPTVGTEHNMLICR